MPAATQDRRLILAIAAASDVDPRTVRRHLRGERVHPAIARAIDLARDAALRLDPDAEPANGTFMRGGR
jgi:hypothetical protein